MGAFLAMSISIKGVATLGVVCALAMSLAACGNDKQANRGTDTVKELAQLAKSRLTGKKGPPAAAPDPLAVIESTMAAIPDAPLQFILLEKNGGFAVSAIYGQNGQNVTWISSDSKSTTLSSGVLTATRGFGGDLMSVEDGGAARLITSRQPGSVEKNYRFLNGEDETERLVVRCVIALGGVDQVNSGEISVSAQVVTESCQLNETFEFSNTYWIDGSSRMVQSIQWAGFSIGNIVFRRLRY
jgi:hypothetical protein